MKHEPKKEWIKPELRKISFAETTETVLVFSVQQTYEDNYIPQENQ